MPFTAHDLRYSAEQSYPLLYAYLHRHAQRYLGSLKYDATEVDAVVGHVVEQLVRLGLLGLADTTPLNALDRMTDAQFYAFLNSAVRNKAIDRLRRRHLQVSTVAELEGTEASEGESSPLNEAVESIWGTKPFASPEEIALFIASQQHLRNMLKHCILTLKSAPHQLEAVLLELQSLGVDILLQELLPNLPTSSSRTSADPSMHLSQQKDHAHKKLRRCLQQQSTNLVVTIALRLTEYGTQSTTTSISTAPPTEYAVTLDTLAQPDLTMDDVRRGLRQLVTEGLLSWQGEETVYLSKEQRKHLTRFYREE